MWGVQFPKVLLDDQQGFPDQGGGVLDLLEALRCCGPEPDRGERGFDDVRRAEVPPVLARTCVVGDHPLPIVCEPLDRFRMRPAIRPREGVAEGRGLPRRIRIRDRLQRRFHFGLVFLGHGVEHVAQFVIPAALLRALGIDRGERAPDPKMAVGDGELRCPQPAALQIPQHCRPTLRRLALSAHDSEHHLLSARIRSDQHEERRFAVLEARLHVDPMRPEIYELDVAQIALLPRGVLRLPGRFEPQDRARTQRRPVTQQPAQRQLEIPEREAVQIQLRQQRGDRWRAALKERKQTADKRFVHVAHTRPPHGDRPVHQREPARLPMSIARAARRIDPGAALRLLPTQQLRHFVLQELLNELLHFATGERLQCVPHRS